MKIEQYFNEVIERATASPITMYISLTAAIIFIVGGILLLIKRKQFKLIKGLRWPGITCMLLGCASLVTNFIQYTV